jgi:hypothetical protein
MGSGVALKRALTKYGKENFNKEILHECSTVEEMYALEKDLVITYRQDKKSYNVMEGGVGGFNYINESGLNGTTRRLELHKDIEWHNHWKEKQKAGAIKSNKSITKEEYSRRGKKANETAKNKNGVYGFEGKNHTPESKNSIGNKNSKHQSGEGNSQYGTIWITDGSNSKKVSRDSSIPSGWHKGRKIK